MKTLSCAPVAVPRHAPLLAGLAALLAPMLCLATPVDTTVTRRVAANWLAEKHGQAVDEEDVTAVGEAAGQGLAVFNRRDGGWVVVAADDRALPVLAYSTAGDWGRAPLPENCHAWIAALDAAVRTAGPAREAHPEVATLWARYGQAVEAFQTALAPEGGRGTGLPATPPTVGPLIQTTWGQDRYYNTHCPADAAGPDGHCLTGCVATAMAQIMRYHRHPATGFGSHTYVHPTYGTLAASFGATTYDWDAMPAGSLTAYTPAVAQLMFHAGVSVEMDYGTGISQSSTVDGMAALRGHFRYHPGIREVARADHSRAEWDQLLTDELDAGRPMVYDGPGHAFLCDGYDSSSPRLYHFNWGWDGLYDGYYALTALTPGSDNFTAEQRAFLGIQPEGDIYLAPPYTQSFEGAALPPNWFAEGDYVSLSTAAATHGAQSLHIGPTAAVGYTLNSVLIKLSVPAGGAALAFDCRRETTATAGDFDQFTCQVRQPYGEEVLATVFDGPARDTAWRQWLVNLRPYAGQDVSLFLQVEGPTVGQWAWMLVDNVRLVDTPIAQFNAPRRTWFANRPLTFVNGSANAATYAWTFPGGTPATSNAVSPTVTYATPGVYDVSLTVTNGNGTDTQSESQYLTILPEPAIPYSTDFEAGDGGFLPYSLAGNAAYQWEWGKCSSFSLKGPTYGTVAGAKSWATVLAAYHGYWCQYALESPPFSFAPPGTYTLSFQFRCLVGANAGFNVEASTDGGASWNRLGDYEDPLGNTWYDTAAVGGLDGQPGWTSPVVPLTIRSPFYDVSAYARHPDVRFRFVFGALGSASDGVQVDNVAINYTAPPTFAISLGGATGPAEAAAGEQIVLQAIPPVGGRLFRRWIGDTAFLDDPSLPAPTLTMPAHDVQLSAVCAFDLELVRGWNAVALPFQPVVTDPAALFVAPGGERAPVYHGRAWRWQNGLRPVTAVRAFEGMWLLVEAPVTLEIEGIEVTPPTILLRHGWNLLGPCVPATLGDLLPGGARAWRWRPGGRVYAPWQQLTPGESVWLYNPGADTDLGLAPTPR